MTSFALWLLLTAWIGVAAVRLVRGGDQLAFGIEETRPLRGVLAMLVVLGHLDNMTGHRNWIFAITSWATPAVAVFFFLSGYGLVKSARGKPVEGLNVSFLWRSAVKLFVPVLIVGLSYVAVRYLTGLLTADRALGLLKSGRFALTPHSWYVRTLFFMYVVFWLSWYVVGFRRGGAWLMVALVTGYWIVFRFDLHWKEWWWATCFSILGGMTVAWFEERIQDLIKRHSILVAALLMAALTAAGVLFRLRFHGFGRLREVFFFLLGPCVYFCLCGFNPMVKSRILVWLGVYSYEIYLIHGTFEKTLAKLHWPDGVYYGVVIGATLLCSAPLHFLSSRISQRLRKARRDKIAATELPRGGLS